MAVEVTGGTIVGTSAAGVPFVQGSDNLIKISIDNPIDINLNTFKDNILPYLDGDNNIVNIEISGADTYVKEVKLLNDYQLQIVTKTPNGEKIENIPLPFQKLGEIEQVDCDDMGIMTVTKTIEGAEGQPITSTERYRFTGYFENHPITSIRKE